MAVVVAGGAAIRGSGRTLTKASIAIAPTIAPVVTIGTTGDRPADFRPASFGPASTAATGGAGFWAGVSLAAQSIDSCSVGRCGSTERRLATLVPAQGGRQLHLIALDRFTKTEAGDKISQHVRRRYFFRTAFCSSAMPRIITWVTVPCLSFTNSKPADVVVDMNAVAEVGISGTLGSLSPRTNTRLSTTLTVISRPGPSA